MKISHLIQQLELLLDENGDLEVVDDNWNRIEDTKIGEGPSCDTVVRLMCDIPVYDVFVSGDQG